MSRAEHFAKLLDLIGTELDIRQRRALLAEVAALFPPVGGDVKSTEAMLRKFDQMAATQADLTAELADAVCMIHKLRAAEKKGNNLRKGAGPNRPGNGYQPRPQKAPIDPKTVKRPPGTGVVKPKKGGSVE